MVPIWLLTFQALTEGNFIFWMYLFPQSNSGFFSSMSWAETQPLQDEQQSLRIALLISVIQKQNECTHGSGNGGFPKTFRCIALALWHKSTVGNLSERSFLLTELFVHRHVFDSFRVERNAAVFKITSFAIACQLSCRLIVDAATPCGTGSFMVLLHWFVLCGMKMLMIGTNCSHQHQGKEHHSHHDHWSNKVAVGTTKCRIWQGTWHLINSKDGCVSMQRSKETCC